MKTYIKKKERKNDVTFGIIVAGRVREEGEGRVGGGMEPQKSTPVDLTKRRIYSAFLSEETIGCFS